MKIKISEKNIDFLKNQLNEKTTTKTITKLILLAKNENLISANKNLKIERIKIENFKENLKLILKEL